jgi:hypothetical protein
MSDHRSRLAKTSRQTSSTFYTRFVLAILLGTIAYCGESYAVSPETPRVVHDYSASFHSAQADISVAPGSGISTLLFLNRPHKPRVTIILPAVEGDIQSLQAAQGGNLVILADLGGGVMDLVILDIATAAIRDEFFCYDPVLSPNGRFIAFTQFFPLHGADAEGTNNFEALYDVTMSPAMNDDAPTLGAFGDARGKLVYPPTHKPMRTRRYNNLITHVFPTAPIWSPDSTKFIILDNIFPADPISFGALRDGNLLPDAAVPPSAAAKLILINAQPGPSRITQYDTGICAPGSSFCGTILKAARFGSTSVTVDVGKTLTISFSSFKRLDAKN